MNGTFANEYWKADFREIEMLEVMEAWEVVDRTEEISVIKSTHDFMLKLFPDGSIKTLRGLLLC